MISLLIMGGCRSKNKTPSISDNDIYDYDTVSVETVDIFDIIDTCAADTSVADVMV